MYGFNKRNTENANFSNVYRTVYMLCVHTDATKFTVVFLSNLLSSHSRARPKRNNG